MEVQITLTHESYAHLLHVLDGMMAGAGSGAVTGRKTTTSTSAVMVNPRVRLLVDALYHVLSGGTVTGTLPSGTTPGTLTVTTGMAAHVAQMKAEETTCANSIDLINNAAGHEHVLSV